MFFGLRVLPLLRLKPLSVSLSISALAGDTLLPGDLLVKEHVVSVPVDHMAGPGGKFGSLDVFVREIVPASKAADADMPCLLYLQGGPGFPSGRPTAPPSGWTKAALSKNYRSLLPSPLPLTLTPLPLTQLLSLLPQLHSLLPNSSPS